MFPSKIKGYVSNDDQFTRKKALPQDKFPDLVNLVSTTTWEIFNSRFFNKLIASQWEDQHLQLHQKIIRRLINKLQYLRHNILQKFVEDLLMIFIPFLNICTWKTSSSKH